MLCPALLRNHISTIVFLCLLPPGSEANSSFIQLTHKNVLAKASQLYLDTVGYGTKASSLSVSLRSLPLSWGDKTWSLKGKGHVSCQYCDPTGQLSESCPMTLEN